MRDSHSISGSILSQVQPDMVGVGLSTNSLHNRIENPQPRLVRMVEKCSLQGIRIVTIRLATSMRKGQWQYMLQEICIFDIHCGCVMLPRR